MTPRDVLLDLIKCNFDGAGWYGGNLLTALRKTDHKLAGKKVGSLKTIYQQAFHAAYWKYLVIRRTSGEKSMKFRFRGSNWPKDSAPESSAAWKEMIAYLRELQQSLIELVEALPEAKLFNRTTLRRLHGVASHDVYHNGQIRLIRKLLGIRGR